MPLGRVLVVEDEPQVAHTLADALTSLGYESQSALNGLDALRLAPLYQPDVVLLDILMPGMSGAEVLDALRRDHPDVPVVMVTAIQDEEAARQTLARGAFDFVRKPFDIDVLARILSAALVYRGRTEAPASGAAGRPQPPERRHPTLLYIEDNPANLRLVELLLEQRPEVRLLTASEGRQGLTVARARRPDLIFLDLHLPDMEGEDVLRAIREDPDLGQTPVIVLSAEAHPTLPAQLLAAGARAYLVKPFDFRQFFALLDANLSPGGGAA